MINTQDLCDTGSLLHKNNIIVKLTEMVIDGAVVVSNICRVKAGISTNLMWKKVHFTNRLRMRNL